MRKWTKALIRNKYSDLTKNSPHQNGPTATTKAFPAGPRKTENDPSSQIAPNPHGYGLGPSNPRNPSKFFAQKKVTRADVVARYAEILTLPDQRHVRLVDVLDHAMDATDVDAGDWFDLMYPETLYCFAISLLETGAIRAVIHCD